MIRVVMAMAALGAVLPACKAAQGFAPGGDQDAGVPPPPPDRCGDGIVQVGEICDDGNTNGGDGCAADCKSDESCGNGVVDLATGETCDDGNTHGGDGCSANCQSNESCGNGIVDPGEDCDSQNKFTATCNPNCTAARCGDGIVNAVFGDVCDDGNKVDTDSCLSSCRPATCGDGFVETGVEQCDDGNTNDNDGCDHSCNIETFINPSFELDFTGWTLKEDSGNPTSGAWAIATDGQTLMTTDTVHDDNDNVDVPAQCLFNGPLTITATDGSKVALQLQTGPEDHRMFQDVIIPATATTLSFDIAYHNAAGAFDPMAQFLAINLRDSSSDAILATVFKTTSPDNPPSLTMSTFTVDVSAFAGMAVRLDVELQVQQTCFDAQFDHFTFQ